VFNNLVASLRSDTPNPGAEPNGSVRSLDRVRNRQVLALYHDAEPAHSGLS